MVAASIIVRSFRRPRPLLELVERLRRQRHSSFEIVIVEQSGDPALVGTLEALGDARIRVLARPPLGAPGARNEGIRHARGEILLFIDDDDLPLDDDWVANHLDNYRDPDCIGVNGRLCSGGQGPDPVRFPRLAHWLAFRYSLFRDPLTLPFIGTRKQGITFAVGNNFSIRRQLIERIGGWDEGIPMGEELSFFFKYERARRPREYLVHDPRPTVWRRVNVAGGLERRTRPDWVRNELRGRVIYYHAVVGHYFPWRFRLLYPLFALRAAEQVFVWIWDPDNAHRGLAQRLRASWHLLWALPGTLLRDGWRAARGVRRVSQLAPAAGDDVVVGSAPASRNA